MRTHVACSHAPVPRDRHTRKEAEIDDRDQRFRDPTAVHQEHGKREGCRQREAIEPAGQACLRRGRGRTGDFRSESKAENADAICVRHRATLVVYLA